MPYTVLLLRPLRVHQEEATFFFGEKELKRMWPVVKSWNLESDSLGINDRLIICDPGLLIAVDLTFPKER